MSKYTIRTGEGRVPVRPIAKFEHRGELFFLHVRADDKDFIGITHVDIGITHVDTGLSAGHIDLYTGYLAGGMKRAVHNKHRLLSMAEAHLSEIPDEKFHAAMAKARGQA